MRVLWRRSISLALAASLVALPAMAGGRKHRHGRGCGHGNHGRSYHAGGPAWGYRPYWNPPRQHHHHHHGVDTGDVLLALGVTAVGLTALSLWTQSQQAAYANAQYGALEAPMGQPVAWSEGGAGGSVVAVSEGYADTGEYCREFQKEIVVGGRKERGYGTACLQEDGSWRIAR
jgi:surface antigen